MENEKERPSFWAIIPATVRYDDVVGSTAKLLFAEITALSNQEGYCWASNQYFAELFKISITQVSRLIKSLEDRGFLKSEVDRAGGNLRKIYPQIITEPVKGSGNKSFKEKFDDLVGSIPADLYEERKAFIDYWTAKNDGGKKEHWQKQKTFAMRQRWSTWLRNNKKWAKPEYKKLPSDSEIRQENKKQVETETQRMIREAKVERTPEEQARINKHLAEMRKKLSNKFTYEHKGS
ncbi:MAG: helix-turn-helix domain-containing protein [Bacteroidia bacterium]|nr:helix-turn-helix domain-containing protein [Bacteroidia bacterium]